MVLMRNGFNADCSAEPTVNRFEIKWLNFSFALNEAYGKLSWKITRKRNSSEKLKF